MTNANGSPFSDVYWRIELGELAAGMAARRATISLDGISVFSEIVYDTDANGNRSEEQAERNIVHLFASRLSRLLEDE